MAARAEDSKTGIVASVVATWALALATSRPAHKAGVMPLLDDFGIVLLRLQVFAGNVDLLLKSPQVDIVAPHVAHQGDQDVAAVFHRGLEIGGGGLEVAPRAPENIHFPGGIETRLPQVPESPDGSDGAAAADFAGALAPLVKRRSIHLGPEGRARHPPGRPGLADAGLGQAHIQVGAHGHFHQGRQGRIVKGGPPFHQRHRIDRGLAGLGRGDDILAVPGGGNLGLRRAVIRAHGAAGAR